MIRILLFSLFLGLMGCSTSKKLSTYQHKSLNFSYLVDIKNIKDDQVKVDFLVQGISEDQLEFCLPKIVPGIYGAMDFGQYISKLKAFDASGAEIKTSKNGTNCWKLESAASLARIEYWVDDTWDVFDMNMEENFYRSAGSSFSPDHYVLNNNCLLGYLKGYENKDIVIYCRSGRRSGDIANYLEQNHGFDNVYNLKGGILAWSEEIDPTVTKY